MSQHRNASFFLLLLTACLGLFASTAAFAQTYNFYQSPDFLNSNVTLPSSFANQAIANKARDNLKKLNAENGSAKKSASAAEQGASGSSSAGMTPADYVRRASPKNNPLPYTRDPALSAKIFEAFMQDYAKQMPDDVASMREVAHENDLIQIIAGLVQLQGMDSAAMESMMALWYGQAWAITHQKPLPTPLQYRGIAEQLRTSIANSPEWRTMNNAQRQTYFERLVYPLFIQKANYQAYLKQGKTDAMARMAGATQQGLKRIGLDLQNMRLIDSGFAPL